MDRTTKARPSVRDMELMVLNVRQAQEAVLAAAAQVDAPPAVMAMAAEIRAGRDYARSYPLAV